MQIDRENDEFRSDFFKTSRPEDDEHSNLEECPPIGGDTEIIKEKIIAALKKIYDPEIPVNIYDLGLIYDISIQDSDRVAITMTLTSPGCPMAQMFPSMVEDGIARDTGITEISIDIVWDPPWTKEMMSEEAMVELGFY